MQYDIGIHYMLHDILPKTHAVRIHHKFAEDNGSPTEK